MIKLFEQILREADKSRFIKPVWDSLQKYNSGEMMNDVSEDIGERKSSEDLPTYEEILKFSNSNASDKYKIDWNKFSKPDPDSWWNESKKLIVSYIDYLKSNKKKNPKGQFQNENFKIMGENKKWLFVAPLNYEAGVYCDSYECGGYGAQWCIGYERSDEYWYTYTQKNKSRFVMAYNKEIYGSPNEQKFMIDIKKDSSIGVWNQIDDEEAVFGIDEASKKFGISQEDINNWKSQLDEILNIVKCFSTFSFSEAQKMTRTVNDIDEIKFIPDGQSVYLKEEENQGHGLNILMRATLASFIKDNSRDVREFVYYGPQYNNKDFSCNSIKMGAYDDLYSKPQLLFFGLNSFKATWIYSDFEAIPLCFENCETVKIGSIVIPVPYGQEKKIEEDLKAWGPSTLFFKTYDIPISFYNCKNVIIDNLFFAPCDEYESVNPNVMYNQEGHDGDWWWNIANDYYDDFDGGQKLSVNSQLFPRLTLNFYTKSKFENVFVDLIDVNTKTIFIDKIIEEPSRPFQKICVINCPFGWQVESEGDLAYEIVTVPRYSKKWDNIKESKTIGILNEGKDYKYKAKIGDLYLQGKDFTSDPKKADVFESETEPRQRISQMKKDKKKMPKGEIVMEKYEELKKSDILNEAETTKYMACCYDPEDYYEETNYISEDGELSCNSSGAKLFNTEDEAVEYADENKPIGWMSFAMLFKTTLNEADAAMSKRIKESINEGDKFKNKNGAVIEIIEYDEDENYVLYKVNGKFYDTHIDSIENILSKNGYKKLNESKFKSVDNFGIHELEQQIKLFLKEDIGLSDNGQLAKRSPGQNPKSNSFYSVSESGSIQGVRFEISTDGQYYDDIIIEVYSAQPVPMGCYEILVNNETWLGKTFEEFKKDFYEAWKEIKSKPMAEETIKSMKESKRKLKESREDTIFDIANECSKILGVSKELPKFRIRNFGTDLVSYNGPKNTIFYHSDLLYISDETFVRTIIAHEMAHWAVGYEHNHDEVWVEAADRLEDSLGDKIYGIFENIDQYDLSDIFKGLEPGKVMKKFLEVYPEIENHYKIGLNTEFGDLVSYNNGALTIRPTFYCANDTKYVTEDQWNIAGVEAETLIDEED